MSPSAAPSSRTTRSTPRTSTRNRTKKNLTEEREVREVSEKSMHPLYEKADKLSPVAIGAAIEVHREFGPGLIESIYERCLARELSLRGAHTAGQKIVKITYKGMTFEEPLRCDLLVDDCLLLELKTVDQILPIHKAQLLSYMKLMNIPVGLILNFNSVQMKDGIERLVLRGASE